MTKDPKELARLWLEQNADIGHTNYLVDASFVRDVFQGLLQPEAVPIPKALLLKIREQHEYAADALIDSHGDIHREILEEIDREMLLQGRLESEVTRPEELPPILFDGYAVYSALPRDVKGWTSAEHVAVVLDTVVKIMRRDRSLPQNGQS